MENIVFDPLVYWPVIAGLAGLGAAFTIIAATKGLTGWWIRLLAISAICFALLNPSLQFEDRDPLSDIVILAVDQTESQEISDRPRQIETAVSEISSLLENRGFEVRETVVSDSPRDGGTELMTVISQTLSDTPANRLAGVIAVTDGQLHDVERSPDLTAPFHVLLTGKEADWDRRLIVKNAPAFGILDEELTLTLAIEDQGNVPDSAGSIADLEFSVDGGPPQTVQVPVGRDITVPLVLTHGGRNVFFFQLPAEPNELTDRNNSAIVEINGVRDRLRVLLVSGEPHAGERTWRNLLKSDAAVDLVHFTILRPPDKQDGVPISELSLIAFPTRELFLEKVDEFDLIIFDRYKRRGILPSLYFDSISDYVANGGAVLVAAGPDFAGADSIYRSSLAQVVPGEPSARVLEKPFFPRISELGEKHPVTEGLTDFAPRRSTAEDPGWGRWLRQIDVTARENSQTVMEGLENRPLLLLERIGDGRVALLASDHAWLWHRGFEGGGPQLELLRRLAHWMMKEPDLEEEALEAFANGDQLTIIRRSLFEEVGEVAIQLPDGTESVVELDDTAPGRFAATLETPLQGLYRVTEGNLESVVVVGPAAPREFIETVASAEKLEPIVASTRGGVARLEEGVPSIREVRPGRNAAGRGWIGLTPRNAFVTNSVTLVPLVSPWFFVLLAVGLTVAAWLREGRP